MFKYIYIYISILKAYFIEHKAAASPQPPTTALEIYCPDLVRAAEDDDGVRPVQVASVVLPLPRH